MRVEDIVGVSFFVVLISAIAVTLWGFRATLTPRQQALWRSWGLGLIGCAVFTLGLVNFLLIHKSPRLVVEGNLWDIRDRFGSGSELNQFMITDIAGHAVLIRCRYRGPGLVEGERARVRYVAYNSKLVEMVMLTGPYQKWRLLESSGEQGWWWWVAIGAACGFFAYRHMAKAGRGRL